MRTSLIRENQWLKHYVSARIHFISQGPTTTRFSLKVIVVILIGVWCSWASNFVYSYDYSKSHSRGDDFISTLGTPSLNAEVSQNLTFRIEHCIYGPRCEPFPKHTPNSHNYSGNQPLAE
ncbi:MAG: hypothetical protein AAF226_14180, partial [Verrucomicrobiota bacterium]